MPRTVGMTIRDQRREGDEPRRRPRHRAALREEDELDGPADRPAGRDRARPACWSRRIPQVLQPYLPIAIVAAMDALFGAFRAYLEGIFTDRVFVVSFISNVLIAAADRLRRRPDRGRLPAVHRGGGGARHPDLHQRRRDPTGSVPCLSVGSSRQPRPRPAGSARCAQHAGGWPIADDEPAGSDRGGCVTEARPGPTPPTRAGRHGLAAAARLAGAPGPRSGHRRRDAVRRRHGRR